MPWLLTELCLHNHLSFSHQADNLWKKKMVWAFQSTLLSKIFRYSTARRHLSGCEIIITSCLIQGEKRLLKTWTCSKNGVFLCLLTTGTMQVVEFHETTVQVWGRCWQQGARQCYTRDVPGVRDKCSVNFSLIKIWITLEVGSTNAIFALWPQGPFPQMMKTLETVTCKV